MGGQIVLLVENESVPSDKRVWIEACVLRDSGYDVTVVCPVGIGCDSETEIELDGVTIRRFPLRRATDGFAGFIVEYLTALWRMARIVWRLDGPIEVIHSANPPDFLFVIGLIPKLRWRTKLVFDHHDLVPELFESRFGRSGPVLWAVRLVERLNFAVADAVISTNESYRRIAIDRGRKRPDQVRVVRNARDLSSFRRVTPDPDLRRGKPFLAVYLGVMGPQDGADCAVRAAAHYRHDLGRDDLQVTFVGDGDSVEQCKQLAIDLEVADMVEFAGWRDFEDVLRYLSTADIGLATDPPSPLNDRSTMIKVIEYMAIGLPVVSFDLPESIVSAGDAALYAPGGDELALARNIATVIDDPVLRGELTERARKRNTGMLSWETAREELLATYRYLESSGV
ncbi:MAG: glycosyltransferase family 4 protein [Acidimicrobiales bacterium]